MAKGYVLVDIPESCSECQLCVYDDIMNFECHGSIDDEFGFVEIPEEIMNNDLKPDWCPIKKLPEELLKPKFKPNCKIPTYFEKYMSQTRNE